MKKLKNYDITHKVMRVRADDYTSLVEISRKAGVPMAEALHLALERQEAVTKVHPAQIPMPVFRVTGIPVMRVKPATSIVVNGAAGSAVYQIKPKGGIIYG